MEEASYSRSLVAGRTRCGAAAGKTRKFFGQSPPSLPHFFLSSFTDLLFLESPNRAANSPGEQPSSDSYTCRPPAVPSLVDLQIIGEEPTSVNQFSKMQLRLEPAHPYQLFPANNRLKSYGHPSGLPSTSAFPFIDTYHQAHNALMNSLPSMMNNAAAACKRQSSLDPALGTFPSLLPLVETSSATSACSPVIPALADFAASMTYLMWHARKRMSIQPLNGHQNLPVDASKPNPAFKKFCLQVANPCSLAYVRRTQLTKLYLAVDRYPTQRACRKSGTQVYLCAATLQPRH